MGRAIGELDRARLASLVKIKRPLRRKPSFCLLAMTVREVSAKGHDEVRLELPRNSFENGPFHVVLVQPVAEPRTPFRVSVGRSQCVGPFDHEADGLRGRCDSPRSSESRWRIDSPAVGRRVRVLVNPFADSGCSARAAGPCFGGGCVRRGRRCDSAVP